MIKKLTNLNDNDPVVFVENDVVVDDDESDVAECARFNDSGKIFCFNDIENDDDDAGCDDVGGDDDDDNDDNVKDGIGGNDETE